jgi:hypothetical protein
MSHSPHPVHFSCATPNGLASALVFSKLTARLGWKNWSSRPIADAAFFIEAVFGENAGSSRGTGRIDSM